uniref:Uncharacterized protein n=1 Tax=Opuntia streptacantha TaxID=393608 RepID=A0A7C9AGM8_OPUST
MNLIPKILKRCIGFCLKERNALCRAVHHQLPVGPFLKPASEWVVKDESLRQTILHHLHRVFPLHRGVGPVEHNGRHLEPETLLVIDVRDGFLLSRRWLGWHHHIFLLSSYVQH